MGRLVHLFFLICLSSIEPEKYFDLKWTFIFFYIFHNLCLPHSYFFKIKGKVYYSSLKITNFQEVDNFEGRKTWFVYSVMRAMLRVSIGKSLMLIGYYFFVNFNKYIFFLQNSFYDILSKVIYSCSYYYCHCYISLV